MKLNQSFISDFSEYSKDQKIKYKLHYGRCTGRRFKAATLQSKSKTNRKGANIDN